MKKAAMAMRNARPGLLERNTANGLSPFLCMRIAMAAIDDSKRKSAAKRNRSRFEREVAGTTVLPPLVYKYRTVGGTENRGRPIFRNDLPFILRVEAPRSAARP
jgi:hypothetical protein